MSLLPDSDSITITEFSGANQLLNEEDIHPPECISLQNCEFVKGAVWTRRGFGQAINALRAITSMYNWFQALFNRLLILDQNSGSPKVVSVDLSTIVGIDVLLTASIGHPTVMTCSQSGDRVIMAFALASGLASSGGYIWDGTFVSSTINVDPLFPRPPLASEVTLTITEPSAGVVDAGLHYFGVVGTSWTGAQTPPGLWSGAAIQAPHPFTSTGGKLLNLQFVPTPTWPAFIEYVQVIMTPIINPSRWFLVPGTITGIGGRSSTLTINIQVNISDQALLDTGTEITNTLFNLISIDPSNQPPIRPHSVVAYGKRTSYLTRVPSPNSLSTMGAAFVSEIDKPQYLTFQFHQLNLPEFRDATTQFVLGSSLYICGPEWTYSFSDNTRYPVQWSACRTVSVTVGSPFIKGVTTNVSRGIAWVSSKAGLHAFDGSSFPPRPLTHQQGYDDWSTINWSAPADALQIVDYSDWRIVVVMAPLGTGQTTANFLLAWDYSDGYTYDTIKYCGKWPIAISGGNLPIGSLAMVHSQANNFEEFWLSSHNASPGKIYRQKYWPIDAAFATPGAIYDDDTRGIDSRYRLASPTGVDLPYYNHLGAAWRVYGIGPYAINAYSLDQTNGVALADIPSPGPTPGVLYLRLLDKQSPSAYYEITNKATTGSYFRLASIRAYFKKWLEQGNA